MINKKYNACVENKWNENTELIYSFIQINEKKVLLNYSIRIGWITLQYLDLQFICSSSSFVHHLCLITFSALNATSQAVAFALLFGRIWTG
jgi:hypothetical protein